MHRRPTSSLDISPSLPSIECAEQPDVGQDIKGIPQGWTDDLGVAIPSHSGSIDLTFPRRGRLTSSSSAYISSAKSPIPGGASLLKVPEPTNPSSSTTPPLHHRPASFRETRSKLKDLAAVMRERARLSSQSGSRPQSRLAGSMDGGVPGTARQNLEGEDQNSGPFLRVQHKERRLSKNPHRPVPPRSYTLSAFPSPSQSSQSASAVSDISLATQKPEHAHVRSVSIHSLSAGSSHRKTAAETDSQTEATAEYTILFTPSPGRSDLHPPSTSTISSGSNRDRVLGLAPCSRFACGGEIGDMVAAAGAKVFLPPNVADILPFAAGHPFSACAAGFPPTRATSRDGQSRQRTSSEVGRRSALSADSDSGRAAASGSTKKRVLAAVQDENGVEGWKGIRRSRGSARRKRVWVDADGEEVATVYPVGWEREVLDLRGCIMYDVAGERHSFVGFAEGEESKMVLDIGTGAGLWPISQALVWPETTFVGLDLVPVQVDLAALARAERNARSTSDWHAPGLGVWESVEKRITLDRGDFLDTLPYDTGIFDMVHLRFLGLGVPEPKWLALIEEATRVLKPSGHLEIVETSLNPPPSSPASLRHSFASLILADLVQPLPALPMQFSLPLVESLKGVGGKAVSTPVFQRTWNWGESRMSEAPRPPGALRNGVMDWVRSALEYKGSGIRGRRDGVVERVKRELVWADARQWAFDKVEEGGRGMELAGDPTPERAEEGVSVWAWVGVKL